MPKQKRIIEISAKCSDLFSMAKVDKHGNADWENSYGGYVPEFFPDQHFGDYVMFRIDVDTGKIINWRKPTDKELERYFKEVA